MSKLTIFLCAVLFASAANASSWSDALESVQRKVVETIDATINKIKGIFEAVHVKAEEMVAKLLEEASNASKKIKDNVDKLLEKLGAEIAEIIGKADGVDVTKCTKLFSHLKSTGLSVISNMSLCVTDKVETGSEYVESMLKMSKDVLANLNQIREEAFHCGDDVDGVKSAGAAIVCVNAAAAKAAWISAKVVPEMSSEFAKLNVLLGTLQPSLAFCTANNGLATFYQESSTIVDRTKKCIQQKIDEVRGTVSEIDSHHHQE